MTRPDWAADFLEFRRDYREKIGYAESMSRLAGARTSSRIQLPVDMIARCPLDHLLFKAVLQENPASGNVLFTPSQDAFDVPIRGHYVLQNGNSAEESGRWMWGTVRLRITCPNTKKHGGKEPWSVQLYTDLLVVRAVKAVLNGGAEVRLG